MPKRSAHGISAGKMVSRSSTPSRICLRRRASAASPGSRTFGLPGATGVMAQVDEVLHFTHECIAAAERIGVDQLNKYR